MIQNLFPGIVRSGYYSASEELISFFSFSADVINSVNAALILFFAAAETLPMLATVITRSIDSRQEGTVSVNAFSSPSGSYFGISFTDGPGCLGPVGHSAIATRAVFGGVCDVALRIWLGLMDDNSMILRWERCCSPARIDFANSGSFLSNWSIALEKTAHRLTVALETPFLPAIICAVIRLGSSANSVLLSSVPLVGA